jgi:fatty-acyl-CoA synthase
MFTRHYPHWPEGLPKTFPVPRDSVYANLVRGAKEHPERTAIHYYGTEISYGELKRDVDALAGYLQQRCGVKKGDRVLLYLQNSPQFVVAYYAVLRADAVVVPINPMNLADELRHYIDDADTAVAIAGQELEERVAAQPALKHVVYAAYSDYVREKTDLPLPEFVRAPARSRSWKDAIGAGLAAGPHRAQAEDLAVMPYTSGTTGKPKGCMHTHSSVQATTIAYLQWRGSGDDSVVLSPLPMFHVTGMQAGMNGPLSKGATLVVMSRWDRECAARQPDYASVSNGAQPASMDCARLRTPHALARGGCSWQQGNHAARSGQLAGAFQARPCMHYCRRARTVSTLLRRPRWSARLRPEDPTALVARTRCRTSPPDDRIACPGSRRVQ